MSTPEPKYANGFDAVWDVDDLPTSDDDRVVVSVEVRLDLAASAVDRRAAAARFGESPTAGDVSGAYAALVRRVTAAWCQTRTAETLVSGGADDVAEAVLTVLGPAAFADGLRVADRPTVRVVSPTLRERQASVAREAERLERIRRTAEVRRTIVGNPGDPGDPGGVGGDTTTDSEAAWRPDVAAVLGALDAVDRATAYAALMSDPRYNMPAIVVGGGRTLVTIREGVGEALDVGDSLDPDAALGPVRSVVPAGPKVFVGRRHGVQELARDDGGVPHVVATYTGIRSSGDFGFNAVVAMPQIGRVVATHAGGGIVWWPMVGSDSSAGPTGQVSPNTLGGSPRAGLRLDDRSAVFAVGGALWRYRDDAVERICPARPADDPAGLILRLFRLGNTLAAVRRGGEVSIFYADAPTSGVRRTIGGDGTIVAAGVVAFPGGLGERLLLADELGGLRAIGPEDDHVTSYRSAERVPFAAVAGGVGTVAAIPADRRRLLIWSAAEPSSPRHELHLTHLTSARLADVAVWPSRPPHP